MENIVKISDWTFTNQIYYLLFIIKIYLFKQGYIKRKEREKKRQILLQCSQSLCDGSSSSSGDISWDAGEAGFKLCVISASDE